MTWGALLGGVLGGIIGALLVIGLETLCVMRKDRQRQKRQDAMRWTDKL